MVRVATVASAGTAAVSDLFGKCRSPQLENYRAGGQPGLRPVRRQMTSGCGPVVDKSGRTVIMLGSNDYLGLSGDERVKRAAIDAVERFGTGCTGSRLMNGTISLHHELEDVLADWLQMDASLVFTTGYSVDLGLVSTLVDGGDAVFVDSTSHAGWTDGAKLSNGVLRPFGHRQPASLEQRLRSWRDTYPGGGGALVAVDGIDPLEGDVAPVAEIASVCSSLRARLLVDEGHALGVVGPEGAGVAAAAGIRPDLVTGTFSKSLASWGGFVAGPQPVIDYLRVACRPLIFTASGVPAALGAALAAVAIARVDDERRQLVLARATQLHRGLRDLGYRVGPEPQGPIVPVHVGGDWDAGRLWRALSDLGVHTSCAVASTVPTGRALLRTSVMATHTEQQIDQALGAFEKARSML